LGWDIPFPHPTLPAPSGRLIPRARHDSTPLFKLHVWIRPWLQSTIKVSNDCILHVFARSTRVAKYTTLFPELRNLRHCPDFGTTNVSFTSFVDVVNLLTNQLLRDERYSVVIDYRCRNKGYFSLFSVPVNSVHSYYYYHRPFVALHRFSKKCHHCYNCCLMSITGRRLLF